MQREAVRFGILGPLVAHTADGLPVELTAAKPRLLLAMLLLRANQPVSADELVDVLWPVKPPRTAAGALRTYAWTLRTTLGLPGLVARPPGYQLSVAAAHLDASQFHLLAQQGEKASMRGDVAEAVDQWARALALWRGGVLDGVDLGAAAQARIAELTERRYSLLAEWARSAMVIGRYAETLQPLAVAIVDQPLRERLHELYMQALYQAGQQAGALAVYRALRDRLVTELGIEPSQPLQRLHRQILSGAGGPVPRQLPPDVAGLVGRQAELAAARAGLPLVAITGAGGVGKSALAVHLAHQLADTFPDGQLYVDLQGAAAGLRPLEPLDVLTRFLRALGAPHAVLPTVAEASAAFRAATATQRLLVVLDNARDTAQVRPLLPAGAHTATLVTSRQVLSLLNGVRQLQLGVLSSADAVRLLGQHAGSRRVAADPAAAAQIAGWCGHLPLALCIAGGRLAARPAWTVRTLSDRLADAHRRLDELQLAQLDVRSTVEVSHVQLAGSPDPVDRAAARALALLGLPNGAELGPPAAAALLDLPVTDADRVLERLVDCQLLESPAPGRYRLHDLVRLFARSLPVSSPAALSRLLRWYAATCWQAFRQLRPADARVATAGSWADGGLAFADVARALDWLEAERPNLVAAVHQVAASAQAPAGGGPAVDPQAATQLARALFAFFHVRGYLNDWIEVNLVAREVARRTGDRIAQAHACRDLGAAHELGGQYAQALECLRDGLAGYTTAGDRAGQAACLNSIGLVHDSLGQLDQAASYLEHSLAISRDLADRHSQAISLNNLGEVYGRLGAYPRAMACLGEALTIFVGTGNRAAQAAVLANLGEVSERQHAYRAALRHYHQSLAIFRELDAPAGRVIVLTALGRVHRHQRRRPQALDCLRQALATAEQLDEPRSVAVCLRELGLVTSELGRPVAARAYWRQALRIFDDLGVPEAGEVRAMLAAPAAPTGLAAGSGATSQPTPADR